VKSSLWRGPAFIQLRGFSAEGVTGLGTAAGVCGWRPPGCVPTGASSAGLGTRPGRGQAAWGGSLASASMGTAGRSWPARALEIVQPQVRQPCSGERRRGTATAGSTQGGVYSYAEQTGWL